MLMYQDFRESASFNKLGFYRVEFTEDVGLFRINNGHPCLLSLSDPTRVPFSTFEFTHFWSYQFWVILTAEVTLDRALSG